MLLKAPPCYLLACLKCNVEQLVLKGVQLLMFFFFFVRAGLRISFNLSRFLSAAIGNNTSSALAGLYFFYKGNISNLKCFFRNSTTFLNLFV